MSRMTKISIPRNHNSVIRIPTKPEQPAESIERIGVNARIASEMIGVSVRTIWNLANQGKIRTKRIGKRVVFSVQSLRDFIDGTKPADNSDTACVAEGKERI
jgi:hypothetical protein